MKIVIVSFMPEAMFVNAVSVKVVVSFVLEMVIANVVSNAFSNVVGTAMVDAFGNVVGIVISSVVGSSVGSMVNGVGNVCTKGFCHSLNNHVCTNVSEHVTKYRTPNQITKVYPNLTKKMKCAGWK